MLFSGACMISLTTKLADSNRLPSLPCSAAAAVLEKTKQRIMLIRSRMRTPFESATDILDGERYSGLCVVSGHGLRVCVNPSLHLVEAGFSRTSCSKEGAGLKAAATTSTPGLGFHTDSKAMP